MQEDPRLRALLDHVSDQLRHDPHHQLIRQIARLRGHDACEYCLQPTTGQFQVDHIVPAAHWPDYVGGRIDALTPMPGRRGPDHLDNVAWCCPFCNLGKRQRVTYRVGAHMLRLFDPRRDHWTDHFTFSNTFLFILGVTPIGVATQQALGFNVGEIGGPLGMRHDSILDGRYPPPWLLLANP